METLQMLHIVIAMIVSTLCFIAIFNAFKE